MRTRRTWFAVQSVWTDQRRAAEAEARAEASLVPWPRRTPPPRSEVVYMSSPGAARVTWLPRSDSAVTVAFLSMAPTPTTPLWAAG
ncbi:hypothetical protein AC230_29155 [Streptomyces caatingaensis]|uniref:Uncharacterized protein n=1 Tax=Streptomyces caatingaensis TaxID=1678637 RepID=A0A0K9X7C7_9ACTN|nr:hypothetical protein AC230_29155 [Streptomyces caatingaensis]